MAMCVYFRQESSTSSETQDHVLQIKGVTDREILANNRRRC